MFPEGSTLRFSSSATPVRVIRYLGGGGQGQVFEVDFAGESMAMKWYFPSCLQRDHQLRNRLVACISATSPNASFLWPILVLDPDTETQGKLKIPAGSFGYVMKLRPPQFQPAVAHTAGLLAISLQQILRACFHLVEAFHALHSKGLCYKDISLGNLFLDPASGAILICDNDNIDVNGSALGGVQGTAGFMAPEVLLGRSTPSSNSDLYSLAVLLFRLLIWRAAWLARNGGFKNGEGSMSKYKASEVAVRVTEDAIQILGGYGYTREYPVERWHRDAKIHTIFEGTSEIQQLVIARAISGMRIE
jgi:serine/threonine protein kinase